MYGYYMHNNYWSNFYSIEQEDLQNSEEDYIESPASIKTDRP